MHSPLPSAFPVPQVQSGHMGLPPDPPPAPRPRTASNLGSTLPLWSPGQSLLEAGDRCQSRRAVRAPAREGPMRPGLLVSCDVKGPWTGQGSSIHGLLCWGWREVRVSRVRLSPRGLVCEFSGAEAGPPWSSLSRCWADRRAGSPLPGNWAKPKAANSKEPHTLDNGMGLRPRGSGF